MSWLRNLIGRRLNPEEQLKKHLPTEEFDKLKKLPDMYSGVTKSMEECIEISNRITAVGVADRVNRAVSECGNEKCPVHHVTKKICRECEEKPCMGGNI
jgi:hypothetical protein